MLSNAQPEANRDPLEQLQTLLQRGLAVENMLWSFRMTDWIIGLQAADIDGDGDTEIVVGSRDGRIKAFTHFGSLKWERVLEKQYLSDLAVIPHNKDTREKQPRIVVGLRNGRVIALNKNGMPVQGWMYEAERIIYQISISQAAAANIVLGSEDQCVHELEMSTGRQLWKYRTGGWVRSVFIYDIDNDGQEEILAGSEDEYIYIFDMQGHLLHHFNAGHQIYEICAAPFEEGGPVHIVASSNHKSLSAWQVFHNRAAGKWKHQRLWLRSPRDKERLVENRIHSLCIQDINNDGQAEILAGSEDGYLVIVDRHGQLLWKENFHACVNQLFAGDINHDGQSEILVGTEDNRVYMLQLELAEHLYRQIKEYYQAATFFHTKNQIREKLAVRERGLMEDFVQRPPSHPPRKEMERARSFMRKQRYEQALSILLRLREQRVQYCWSRPFRAQGYIWTGFPEKLANLSDTHLVIGTDQGYIYGLDTSQKTGCSIWKPQNFAPNRVRILCPGPRLPGGQNTIIAVLSDSHMALLDTEGNFLRYLPLPGNADNWPRCAYYYPGNENEAGAILVGTENNSISFWDEEFREQIGQITLPEGVWEVCACDIQGNGKAQIISGTLKSGVYAHTWEGEELWCFQTSGRVKALHVADIDRDGLAEIIVGAEDCNVYVLDNQGHLKWRYRTRRGIIDIKVCDLKIAEDTGIAYGSDERAPKLLVSCSDGYLYTFNAEGNLLWKYHVPNRLHILCAHDLNADGLYEIAIAFEDQLELLQVLDSEEIDRFIKECWDHLITNEQDKTQLRRFITENPDEYIRGGALSRLAGTESYSEEDFRYLQRALKEKESSFYVKQALVRASVNLCQRPESSDEQVQQARQLLERLYLDPDEEVRLLIMNMQIYPVLQERFFDYLERSTDYADIWVRHTVVRQIDRQFEANPERFFRLLLKTAGDDEEWIRQESGRVLAHYFSAHIPHLIADLSELLEQRIDLAVLQQLAYSVNHPALRSFFQNLLQQLQLPGPEHLGDILDEAIRWISVLKDEGILYGEELLQIYEEFRQLLSAHTINAIAGYQRATSARVFDEAPRSLAEQVAPAFDALDEAARIVATYERRQTIGERVSSLIKAGQTLEKVHAELRQRVPTHIQGSQIRAQSPLSHILLLLVEQWASVIGAELARMSGSARLICELGNASVERAEETVIVLRLKNDGQCAADNVRIELEESADFAILAGAQQTLTEVSTKSPVNVNVLLHLHTSSARLIFHLTYDDAERREKKQQFAEKITVREYQRPYHHISNPYTTGTPIRKREMFYGRKEDLRFLRESLGSMSANRVVLLWGQRRMGKTSLIYQLAQELAHGSYLPVFIDLQSLALRESAGQLLESFAQRIASEIWNYKKVQVAGPSHEYFLTNPTAAFPDYLSTIWTHLPDHRLILLIDEFNGISRYIQRDGENILYYLRSLMQHHAGLHFLLSGPPHMPHMEGYQSVFFNIAQEHRLGKLKPEEARELITRPAHDDLEYDSLAIERMLELTDGWPYFIHVMSEKLIQYCNMIQKSYVTVSEINAALHLVLEEQASSLRWIWQDLSSIAEKLVLSLLAQEKGVEGRIFSLNDIQRSFDSYGVPYMREKVINALSKLTRGEIVAEQFDGVQYSIPVGLIKAWLRKEKPPERVMREENFSENELDQ